MVLHYTAMESCAEARARLCDPEMEVSAHWLIDEAGRREALVDEAHRAWHAGAGSWGGAEDINSRSIGIELANRGTHPFAEAQMAALEGLLTEILRRWQIPARGVIGHSDLAPGRKFDPGPRFDWRRLARQGLSVWEEADPGYADWPFGASARRFGYTSQVSEDVILDAFRMRFRPGGTGPESSADRALMGALAARHGAT